MHAYACVVSSLCPVYFMDNDTDDNDDRHSSLSIIVGCSLSLQDCCTVATNRQPDFFSKLLTSKNSLWEYKGHFLPTF